MLVLHTPWETSVHLCFAADTGSSSFESLRSYNSIIQTENGVTDSHVFLRNNNYYDHQVFPSYPNPLVSCPMYAADCTLPAGFTQGVTHEVSAFAPNFVTPRVQQSSLTIEKEVLTRTTLSLSLLNVRGEHLIRALDVNLPQPIALSYPIFDSTGSIFEGGYYSVDSFATWQFTRTLECPWPPCINPLGRPIAELGSINEFQSAASSNYNGATLSMNRRIARGTYFRLSYAYSRAMPLMEDIELSRRLKRRGRLAALPSRVTTSARKWEREGALRTMALMWVLRFLYMVGVSPARLHRWYYGRDA